MRIAFFAPVNHPERPEGREALRLARTLARKVELTVYVRLDPTRPTPAPAGLVVESQERFERAALAGCFDHVLYLFTNEAYTSEYVGRRLDTERGNRAGGIVLLRDATLQHYFQTITLYRGEAQPYLEAMAQAHGDLGRQAGPVVVEGGGHDALFRELDLLRVFLESAAAVVVSTSALGRRVESLEGQLAHLVACVPRGVAAGIAREELRGAALAQAGLSPIASGPVFAIRVGSTPVERSEALAQFQEILGREPNALVVLLGGERPDELPPRAGWLPGAPADEGDLPGWDGVVDLREPVQGQVLTEVLRWMGAGIPVVAGRFTGFDDIPDAALARVPARVATAEVARLLLDAPRARRRAEAGRRHVEACHSLEAEIEGLLRFLRTHGPELEERAVWLGNIREHLLAKRRHELCVKIREAVLGSVPLELLGEIGAQWARDVDAELMRSGIDFLARQPRSGSA